MSDIWVYKADGTLQCGMGQEISLDQMRTELETLIGKNNVSASEKRTLPGFIIDLCGAPTGKVNAYKITAEGLYVLFHGFVGSAGFRVWTWPDAITGSAKPAATQSGGDAHPWPWSALFAKSETDEGRNRTALTNLLASLTEVNANPTTLREIIGRPVRVYKTGDALTKDFRPERVNIEVSEAHQIARIWFG
jgi:hypothetical protein